MELKRKVIRLSLKKYPVLLLMLFVFAACDSSSSDDESNEATLNDFVGSWKAVSHTFTSTTNTSQSIDLISLGGETRFTVLATGGVRTWVIFGEFSDEWDSSFVISGNQITTVPVESSRETVVFTYQLNGTVLTLTRSNSSFDFTLSDQVETSATEVIVLNKQ